MLSVCQKLSKLVEISQSYCKSNFAVFFDTQCTKYLTKLKDADFVKCFSTGHTSSATTLQQQAGGWPLCTQHTRTRQSAQDKNTHKHICRDMSHAKISKSCQIIQSEFG